MMVVFAKTDESFMILARLPCSFHTPPLLMPHTGTYSKQFLLANRH